MCKTCKWFRGFRQYTVYAWLLQLHSQPNLAPRALNLVLYPSDIEGFILLGR